MASKLHATFGDLPDVILLEILKYLSFKDLLAVSTTNQHLSNVCLDRTLIRHTNLEECYMLHEDDLKQFMHQCSSHVRILNLNHCYWLSQTCIRHVVSQCTGLQELHVIECRLPVDVLVPLLCRLPRLTALSFSITKPSDLKCDTFSVAQHIMMQLRRLHMFVTIPRGEDSAMSCFSEHESLLSCCKQLEQLHIRSTACTLRLLEPVFTALASMASLHTLVLHASSFISFEPLASFESLMRSKRTQWLSILMPNLLMTLQWRPGPRPFYECLNMPQLHELDIAGNRTAYGDFLCQLTGLSSLVYLNLACTHVCSRELTVVSTNCPLLISLNLYCCPSIFKSNSAIGNTDIDLEGMQCVITTCPGLRHLNISGEHHHINDVNTQQIKRVITSLNGLKSLSLSACSLFEVNASLRSSAQRDRTSLASVLNTGVVHDLVHKNPDLQVLEIVANKFMSYFQDKFNDRYTSVFEPCKEARRVHDDTLLPIGQLTQLHSLTLIGASGLRGSSLIHIAQGCINLQHLSIGFLGAAMLGNILPKIFKSMLNLVDLRIEQPNLVLNAAFIDGLVHCVRLQRLCIIAKSSAFQSAGIVRLMEQLIQLVVLQLFTGAAMTACRQLTTTLENRFRCSRPALNVFIHPLQHYDVHPVSTSVPVKHLRELTYFASRVCFEPPKYKL